jgi:hypothetical protein
VEDDALSAFHQTVPSRYEEKNVPVRGIKQLPNQQKLL